MAVKTITIDMEAYNLLADEKKPDESFSKVIKRTLKRKNKTADSFLQNIDKMILSNETLDNAEKILESRKESIISSEILNET